MRFFSRHLSLSLSLCNIASAGINFVAILFYSQAFGLAEIGILATVTSMTALLMPLMTFRLDLAFQRLSEDERPSLTAAMLVWILGASVIVTVIVGAVYLVSAWQSGALLVAAIPLHLGLSAVGQALWAQNVCNRRLGSVATLQVVRSLLAATLPYALVTNMGGAAALICGQLLAQIILILFLPAIRHFQPAALRRRVAWVRTNARDLVFTNTWPLLINAASLHLNPILAALIFGPEAAAIIWMVIRIFLTPSSMIADPIRRDYYASHTDGRKIVKDVRKAILRHKVTVGLVTVVLIGGIAVVAGPLEIAAILGELGRYPLVTTLGLVWAGAILFNAPSTGLIPVLGMARIQTGVEVMGFTARIGTLMLGLVGLEMIVCLTAFLALTILINLSLGALVDLRIWHHARTVW